MVEKDGGGGMISNVYMKHTRISLRRRDEKKEREERNVRIAVIIFAGVMLGICILPQLLYGMEAMR